MTQTSTIPRIGDMAPDFALPGPEQQTVRLSDYRGRCHIILAFYPFDFSPVCSQELPAFQEQLDRFAAVNAQVLGISTDSVHAHHAFSAELGLTFPLLSDIRREVTQAYGVLRPEGFSERATFIVDKTGRIRDAQVHDMDEVPDVEALLHTLAQIEATEP